MGSNSKIRYEPGGGSFTRKGTEGAYRKTTENKHPSASGSPRLGVLTANRVPFSPLPLLNPKTLLGTLFFLPLRKGRRGKGGGGGVVSGCFRVGVAMLDCHFLVSDFLVGGG